MYVVEVGRILEIRTGPVRADPRGLDARVPASRLARGAEAWTSEGSGSSGAAGSFGPAEIARCRGVHHEG